MASDRTKILVADDDAFIRDVLAAILEAAGYEVHTAEDGAEAFDMYCKEPNIGMVISDMNMPGVNGLELIGKLRGMDSDVPIIILTGNNEISIAINALKTGASDYILKDENIQETIGIAVDKALEKHFLKKQNLQLMKELAQRNAKLEHEKALAQKVQKNILPGMLTFQGFEISSFYRPSDKIGGDFFDAWENSGVIHFLVGDVSGHSTSSALIMAVSKGILQSLGHTLSDPREIVKTANCMICDIVSDSGMFLTLLYGTFDRARDRLCIVSAGHNPVFLASGGDMQKIGSTGPVLGWDAEDSWEAVDADFPPEACLVLYTDGLTEVRDGSGMEFGEERLGAIVREVASPPAAIRHILSSVEDFCDNEFQDDLTLLIIKRDSLIGSRIISMKFAPSFGHVDKARMAVSAACRERFTDTQSVRLIDELLLAATEAMNNAVEHSGAGEVGIDVQACPNALVFSLTTEGERFDPTEGVSFPDLDKAVELPEGGFGRALIAAMTDSVRYDYREGRNILTLEKNMISKKEDQRDGD